jgi:hypothetical protein
MNKIYSYQELFELIRLQQEKEKDSKSVKPTRMENVISEALRALNNPTTQNLNRTINIALNQEKPVIEPDNRLNYIYKAP